MTGAAARAAVSSLSFLLLPVSAGLARAATDEATAPFVFLAEGDAVIASTPGAPDDPPEGPGLRLRRLRAGEDVTVGRLRLRAVLEHSSDNATGAPFTPMEGGRIAGPVRVTDAFVRYTPHVAFQAELGSMRVPFSLSRQIDAGVLRFPERAPIIDAVTPDFRVGAGVGGDLGALAYRGAVMAADPSLDRTFSGGMLVAARLAAEPIGPVGLVPWRRTAADPWDDWLRFAVGVSFLYGTLVEPRTTAAGVDAQLQWRALVVTGEYVYRDAPSGTEQGAVVEPGVSVFDRHVVLAGRADWRRAAAHGQSDNQWGAGAAVTAYAPDPRVRLQAAFERRTAAGVPSGWAILRLTVAIN